MYVAHITWAGRYTMTDPHLPHNFIKAQAYLSIFIKEKALSWWFSTDILHSRGYNVDCFSHFKQKTIH